LLASLAGGVGGLADALSDLVAELDGIGAAQAPPGPVHAVDRECVSRQLKALCELLADSDLRALEVHAQWAAAAGALDPDRGKALADALAGLDFSLALNLAREWASEIDR
jgi:hypothetical protein